jgi:outer membrane exchange protein TraA
VVLGALTLLSSSAAWAVRSQALQTIDIDINDEPIAPSPLDDKGDIKNGQGICAAFRAEPQALSIFPFRNANYPGVGKEEFLNAANQFMDGMIGSSMAGTRQDATLETAFDLSNFANIPGIGSSGDFINTRGCPQDSMLGYSPGCLFPAAGASDVLKGFGTRFRGFINVRPEWVPQVLHFGFYTDDSVSVALWSKRVDPVDKKKFQLNQHLLISRASDGSTTKYRVTNGIKFPKPGLYPIEIVHATYRDAAVLEFAIFGQSRFDDIDEPTNMTSMTLSAQGFSLEFTQPANFFQTASGAESYPGKPSECKQCPRSQVNTLATDKCGRGYYCNEAALCSPCVGDQFCGNSCTECKAPEPFCVRDPRSSDPNRDYTCVQCRDDNDCSQGLKCVRGQCKNPCNCCPDSPFCVATETAIEYADVRNCSQCRTKADCGEGRDCDLLNARCVDGAVPENNKDDRCGPEGVNCPVLTKDDPKGPRPFCFNAAVCTQCRFDYHCKAGTYCRNGDCVPCTHDRHCGPSCKSCGLAYEVAIDGDQVTSIKTDKPFCLTPSGDVQASTCVRCLTDAQCGEGGVCNPSTHECENKCQVTCEPGKLCDGGKCVECLTSSQCPCGQCQDGTCTTNCVDTTDCSSNQCCQKSTGQCVREKCGPGTAAGGALCCGVGGVAAAADPLSDPASTPRTRGPLLALLGAVVILYGLQRRRRAGRIGVEA